MLISGSTSDILGLQWFQNVQCQSWTALAKDTKYGIRVLPCCQDYELNPVNNRACVLGVAPRTVYILTFTVALNFEPLYSLGAARHGNTGNGICTNSVLNNAEYVPRDHCHTAKTKY